MTKRLIKALNIMIEELRFEIERHENVALALRGAIRDIDKSWSGWGEIYQINFLPAHENGLDVKYRYATELPGNWRRYTLKEIDEAIRALANISMESDIAAGARISEALEVAVNRFNSVVSLTPSDQYLMDLCNKIKEIYGDRYKLDHSFGPPEGHHWRFLWYRVDRLLQLADAARHICRIATSAVEHLKLIDIAGVQNELAGNKVFIGHGRSPLWLKLKDSIQIRLGLPWDEFNRVPIAGVATAERLSEMLDDATFAFLVFTGEDEVPGESTRARENVVHEAGLFQGRLGFRRAIILIEAGCGEFSNIHGLGQVQFPRGKIEAIFEQVRQVLEREGVVDNPLVTESATIEQQTTDRST